jgi:RimJ/RimL family protein N-acetyltransferase
MFLKLKNCEIRSLREEDASSLAHLANNRKIWINLRDAFPHPYTYQDAETFIKNSASMNPESNFAIVVDDQAVGCIGIGFHKDVERLTAEIGYWLGEPFWNKGIMTQVVSALTDYIITEHQFTRIYAVPFEWNKASIHVLKKAGYQQEARMKKSAIKDGQIIDQMLYAYTV